MVNVANKIVSIIIPTLNEEKNIKELLINIYEQRYRPIDVLISDVGSLDKTRHIVIDFATKLSPSNFTITLIKGEDYGSLKSPAFAKNIGVLNAKGKYIIFIDADMRLLDKDFIMKVKEKLDENPWVGVKAKPLIDTILEKSLVAESATWYRNSPSCRTYMAIRRELAEQRLFDTNLGVYEDVDYFEFYLQRTLRITPLCADTSIGIHDAHTFSALFRRERWYGRTIYYFVHKHLKMKNLSLLDGMLLIFERVLPITTLSAMLVIAFIPSMPLYLRLSLAILLMIIFAWRRIRFYMKMPNEHKSIKLFIIITFIELIFRPFAYSIGLVEGMFRILINKQKLSR